MAEVTNSLGGNRSRFWGGFADRNAGLIFALCAILLALYLLVSKSLEGTEEYLHALYFQAGYEPDITRGDIVLLKKDEYTSELLERNPNRGDFASILRTLTRPHFAKYSSGGRFAYYGGIELKFGRFAMKSCPVVSSLNEWDRAILANRAKEGGGKAPERPAITSFFGFSERLWTPKGTSVLKVFELPDEYPAKPDEKIDNAILEKWEAFFLGLFQGYVTIDIRAAPDEETLFSITALFNKPGLPPGRWVTPASVVAWDFVLQGKKPEEADHDRELQEAIALASVPIVLAAQINETVMNEKTIVTEGPDIGRAIYSTTKRISQVMPEKDFLVGPANYAFINVGVTGKGNVNRLPLFIEPPGDKRLEPAFCLMISACALDRRAGLDSNASDSYVASMKRELERITPLWQNGSYRGGFRLRDIDIPCDSNGTFMIKFVGSVQRIGENPPVFPAVSFYECFDTEHLLACASASMNPKNAAKLDPAKAHVNTLLRRTFGNRICLAGPFEATDFDFYSTPLSVQTPFNTLKENLFGIEIHANAVQNIIDRKFLRAADTGVALALLILGTTLLGFLLDRCSPGTGVFLLLSGMTGLSWLAYHSYHAWGRLMIISPCLVSFPITWAATVLTNYFRQRAKANTTKAMFSRFVSKDVVQYMLEHPDLVRPGGQKVEMTVFFSDVAGFTSISEALTPEELVVLLNEYLGTMTDILFKYGGTLDKFIGDAVMAFWNFPKGQPDHAVRACLCALEMQTTITELQKGWAKRGLPKVAARCGMNTAHVVVGYMGSIKAQMNFTCMGDGVNLASRLEGANKEYGTMMMVSDATYQQAKDRVTVRFLDFLAVKGKKEPVKVHELVCEKGKEPPGWSELSELYDTAIKLHLDRKWDEAIAKFEELLARWPDDGPSKTYIGRCQEYKINPPPENWDGSYHLTHK